MKQVDALFELIKSLNKSEKGYFKKFVSIYSTGKENNYLYLFNLVDSQKEYDEDKLKDALSKVKKVKWLSSEKKYLHQLILKALRNYHTSESIDNQLSELLTNIQLLHKKALYNQCLKVIEKAKSIATKSEKFTSLLEILHWEKNIYSYNRRSEFSVADSFEKETHIIEKLHNEHCYEKLSFEMSTFTIQERYLRNEETLSKMKKIINDPLLQNERLAISSGAKIMYHNTWARYHEIKSDFIKSKESFKKILEEIDRDPELAIRETFLCISTYNNYLNICLIQDEFEEHRDALNLLQKLVPAIVKLKPESMAIRFFEVQYNHHLAANIGLGNFKDSKTFMPEIEEKLIQYEGKMVRQAELTIYYNLAYTCIGMENYKHAKIWVNKIINDPAIKSSPISQDTYAFALIFNLIIQYELKNYDGLGYYWRSAYRYLFKRKKLYKTENIFLQFFRKNLTGGISKKEIIPAFKQLLKELNKVMQDPFEKQVLNYFDIISWLESKMLNNSFSFVVREKYKNRLKGN